MKVRESVTNAIVRASDFLISFFLSFVKSGKRTRRKRLGTFLNSPAKLLESTDRIP